MEDIIDRLAGFYEISLLSFECFWLWLSSAEGPSRIVRKLLLSLSGPGPLPKPSFWTNQFCLLSLWCLLLFSGDSSPRTTILKGLSMSLCWDMLSRSDWLFTLSSLFQADLSTLRFFSSSASISSWSSYVGRRSFSSIPLVGVLKRLELFGNDILIDFS